MSTIYMLRILLVNATHIFGVVSSVCYTLFFISYAEVYVEVYCTHSFEG